MGIVTPCDNIFRVILPAKFGDITVNAQLTAATEYWYIVTDKFMNEYAKQVTTDGQGSFNLLAVDFPVGLFTPYSGSFLLQVKKTLQDAAPQPLKFCNVNYDTVQMDFVNASEDVPDAIINCK